MKIITGIRLPYGTYTKATQREYMRIYQREWIRQKRARLREQKNPPAEEKPQQPVIKRSSLAPRPPKPIAIRRHDVGPHDAALYGCVAYDVYKNGNSRYLGSYEPVVAEQVLRALRQHNLPINDPVHLKTLRIHARAAAAAVQGRLSDDQVAAVITELRRRKKTGAVISHLGESVRIARRMAEKLWRVPRPQRLEAS